VIRLGLRLALSDGRRSLVAVALTAAAVAIGTAILLFAISFQPALGDRDSRQAWRQPLYADGTSPRLLMAEMDDRYAGQTLVRVFLAPQTADAPIPPGIDRLPKPGEAFVSPALADLLARTPADQLSPRIGRVVGTIGPQALRSPQELVAIIGMTSGAMDWSTPVDSFRTESLPPNLPPVAILILVLAVVGALVPVAVFVSTATRLAAARREQRLAALRLIGATPGQVARLAVVEALLYTAIGTPAGVALFFALRPGVALIPLDGATWWPQAMVPPLLQALALIAAVQVVGAAAALFGMRRLNVSPLGVQQRVTPPSPSAWRAVPTLAGLAGLLAGTVVFRGASMAEPLPLVVMGGSFAAIIGGIAFAGPWLTAVVGRVLGRFSRGPAGLLAGRRLADDPRGSFGAIAGVIMAVFVASAFFSFLAYAQTARGRSEATLRAGEVSAQPGSTPLARAEMARLSELAGVTGVISVRGGILVDPDQSVGTPIWVVSCADLLDSVDVSGATCGHEPITAMTSPIPPGVYTIHTSDWWPESKEIGFRLEIGPATTRDLVPAPQGFIGLPTVIVNPAFLGPAADFLPITRLYIATDGTPAAAERVRTAIQEVDPMAPVLLGNDPIDLVPQFAEVARIVGIGLIGSLALAGCSLAVATVTGLLGRRRQFALLRATGMPMSRLRALVLLQAGVPLLTVSLVSALLGVVVAQGVLRSAAVPDVPLPDPSLVVVLGASLSVAMAVVAATLPGVDRMTRPQSVRSE
jgi:cell division protein FtsX